jgi:serine/alanine adding enzyme
MKITRSLQEETWRHFLSEHPAANIFHTPEMFKVFAQTKGYQPTLWAVVDDNQQPLALFLPVQVTLMNGPLRQVTTRAIAYGSILCVPGPIGHKALDLLLSAYKQTAKNDALFTELRNLHDLSNWQTSLNEHGFTYEAHLNYLINLNLPTEQLLQNIGQRTRKRIRKGLRDGVVQLSEVSSPADLDHWYNTLQKTYDYAHIPLADHSMFKAAFKELHPKGMAKFFLAKIEGVTAACSIELLYKDTIYGWYGGTDRSFSQYNPNEMLMWCVLEWGATHGYRVYDFGGAGKPDEKYGVRDFKAKFGGKLVCFGRNTYVHAPLLLKLSTKGYHIYRHLKNLSRPSSADSLKVQDDDNSLV